MGVFYRGSVTGREYQFISRFVMPTTLLDGNGTPLAEATYNGELVVACNRDGSMARGTAGAPPPTDIYAPGWAQSLWEQAVQPTGVPGDGSALAFGLPRPLGY